MSEQAEWFDVVDEADRVVGRQLRSEVHRLRLKHRAVHIFVFNSKGELFLQKRSPTKDQLPNCWTSSCSGHVDSGEDYDVAAVRELGEELGIGVPGPEVLDLLGKVGACRQTGWEFVQLYRLLWDGPLDLDPVEIAEGRWLSRDDLVRWLGESPKAFAPSFRLLWEKHGVNVFEDGVSGR